MQHAKGVRLILSLALACSLILLFGSPTLAIQAALPITPAGLNTQVTLSATPPAGKTQFDISGGTRPGGGVNLYHSFGNFNVPTNNIANFLNSGSVDLAGNPLATGLPTSNILARVNGGNPSSIFGMIQTNGSGGFPNANLFLMNPNGFLFGQNATINVGGMASFTTADYVRLTDNARFNALSGPADGALTAAPVAAFGFLGNNPAAIAIQGSTLRVTDGRSLSLVGGNQGFIAIDPDTGNPIPVPGGITMNGGKLLAPGGQINMASVAGPGEISAVDFVPTPGMTMGNVTLSQGALLDVSAGAAGTVRIRGGQLVMHDATISADTNNTNAPPTAVDIHVTGEMTITDTRGVAAITARTTGTGDAGDVQITAGNLTATTTFVTTKILDNALIQTNTSGPGKAGNVSITTGNLAFSGPPSSRFAFIDSGTKGPGHGGDVTITAKNIDTENTMIATGDFIGVNTLPDALPDALSHISGSAGNLTITADSLKASSIFLSTSANAAIFSALAPTQAGGDMTLNVRNIDISTGRTDLYGPARGGALTIKADTFRTDHFFVQTNTIFGQGGDITINAHAVEVATGSGLTTGTFGDANAGDIRITATDHVTLGGVNLFSASTGGYSTRGDGNAGNVVITTPILTVVGGRITSQTGTSGQGGNVIINASAVSIAGGVLIDPLLPQVPSGIATSTSPGCSAVCGNAGNISITTGTLGLGSGARISSDTGSTGLGGNITISAAKTIALSGSLTDPRRVGIFSESTAPGSGSGGNISLIAGQALSISNASVSASTAGPGNGGNILLKANDVAITGGSTITAASTGAGKAGTVTIQGLNSPANSVLVDGAGSGIVTTTTDTGTGGNISIDANAITLQNGAHLSSSSTGPGNTGNINITAGYQFVMTNSSVSTEAHQSGGGVINITTNPHGIVHLTDSRISASVLDGTGGGGSVNIDPQFVILQNSQIIANAVVGPGGNVNIMTNLLLLDANSVASASSQFLIQSPIAPAGGRIFPLSQKPLIETALMSQRCAASAEGIYSSFAVAGRDSLPPEPGGWLSSPLALASAEPVGGSITEPNTRTSGEPATDMPILSLRRIAPPGFLTHSFAWDISSGCRS